MSNEGWGILFVLVIIAITCLPAWCFYVGIFFLVSCMVAEHRKTGNVPKVSEMIERKMVKKYRNKRR